MEAEKSAKDLFVRINYHLSRWVIGSSNSLDARGKPLVRVKLSTDEKRKRNEPWKGVFYLHFYYADMGEKPIPVGIGSFTRNKIAVDRDIVPGRLMDELMSFSFWIEPLEMNFEQIKKVHLPHYQKSEAAR